MVKTFFFLLAFVLAAAISKAQTADSALVNRLGDFDIATLNGDTYSAVIIGEKILPDTPKMPSKGRISFFAKLAKAYDDTEQGAKAIVYYEKVAAAEPDYYVVQRALGYLYNENAEEIQLKLYITPNDNAAYASLYDGYRKAVLKTLPFLEKAQACDPDDDTLDLIRTLYQNIHDEQRLKSLDSRLPDLGKNCVDLLSDK